MSLTSNITANSINRLKPENILGKITSQTDLTSKEQELEKQLVNNC